MRFITLTTDFGTSDWFVGTMKGVIGGIAPAARVVDLTHAVPPGDIRAGAFALAAAYHFFPRGTIHVAVVDPGVGSARKAIAVRTTKYLFIGPDNGLLSWALRKEKVGSIHAIENPAWFLQPLSRTFHGRDLFAPVAGHLSRGVPIAKLGPRLNNFVRLPWPEPRVTRRGIEGEILYIDQFGNAITNIDTGVLDRLGKGKTFVYRAGKRLCPVGSFYEAVATGFPVAVLGSSNLLEISINGGNAEKTLRLGLGEKVLLGSDA